VHKSKTAQQLAALMPPSIDTGTAVVDKNTSSFIAKRWARRLLQ
jgi:hypothetical protein